ncbi:MAG: flagellar basal body P-ring formation chaperone FlgA [Verrucomicrobiota bacterium JB022]|nr:flagellar basal body P-ring formation chaperone FlgA [Verrucomicrobiota bacterium JB022]
MIRILQSIPLLLVGSQALVAAPADSLMALLEPVAMVEAASQKSAAPVITSAPAQAKVVAESATVMELGHEVVVGLLQAKLASYYRLSGDLVLQPQGRVVPAAVKGSYDLQILSAPADLSQSVYVRYQITSDGVPVQQASLQLRAEHWLEVYVARQSARRGEAPQMADLILEKVDTLRYREELVDAAVDLGAYELALPTQPNRPLAWRNLTTRPLIKKGALIDAQASNLAMVITLPAVALEDGQKGDFIRVRNLQSRKDITARVIDENVVQVNF